MIKASTNGGHEITEQGTCVLDLGGNSLRKDRKSWQEDKILSMSD